MIPLPEIVPLDHHRYATHLYDLDPRFRVFEYQFRHATSESVRWCQSNFGSSALISLPTNLGGGEGVYLGGRWIAWGFSVYITDQTDATAYRMVFG